LKRAKWVIYLFLAALATTVTLVVLYITLLWVAHDFSPHFLQIDACLDNGERWNYDKNICEGERTHYKE
jgi:hypothetical protein